MSKAISTFILAHGLNMALDHIDKSGLVVKLAQDIDKLADERLGVRSEPFQEKMLKELLLPLCRELMWENPQRYTELLISESKRNFGGPERQLDRGSSQQITEDWRVSGLRRETQQKGQNFTVRNRSNDNGK